MEASFRDIYSDGRSHGSRRKLLGGQNAASLGGQAHCQSLMGWSSVDLLKYLFYSFIHLSHHSSLKLWSLLCFYAAIYLFNF